MSQRIRTFLMFTGEAEAAMQRYAEIFDDAEIVELERWPEGGPSPAGTVLRGTLELGGQRVMFTDSPPVHDFSFTPATSLWVDCPTPQEVDRCAAALADGGSELMPVGSYPFSERFGWVVDRFGVSWQISLA